VLRCGRRVRRARGVIEPMSVVTQENRRVRGRVSVREARWNRSCDVERHTSQVTNERARYSRRAWRRHAAERSQRPLAVRVVGMATVIVKRR